MALVKNMHSGSTEHKKRRGERKKAVLPVRIKGTDAAGQVFEELAHTLDVTAMGVRLGSVRRDLTLKGEITLLYRQRKMQYRVMWTKKMQGTSEFQVGLQAITVDREGWGLSFEDQGRTPMPQANASPRISGVA